MIGYSLRIDLFLCGCGANMMKNIYDMVVNQVNPKCGLRVECVGNRRDNSQFLLQLSRNIISLYIIIKSSFT